MRLTLLLSFSALTTAQQWPWSDTCFQDTQKSKTANCSQNEQTIVKKESDNATNSNAKPTNTTTAKCSMVKAVKVTPKCHPGKATYFDPDSEEYASHSFLLHFLLIVM